MLFSARKAHEEYAMRAFWCPKILAEQLNFQPFQQFVECPAFICQFHFDRHGTRYLRMNHTNIRLLILIDERLLFGTIKAKGAAVEL